MVACYRFYVAVGKWRGIGPGARKSRAQMIYEKYILPQTAKLDDEKAAAARAASLTVSDEGEPSAVPRGRAMSFHPSQSPNFRGMDLDEKIIENITRELDGPDRNVSRGLMDEAADAIEKRMELGFSSHLVKSPVYKTYLAQLQIPPSHREALVKAGASPIRPSIGSILESPVAPAAPAAPAAAPEGRSSAGSSPPRPAGISVSSIPAADSPSSPSSLMPILSGGESGSEPPSPLSPQSAPDDAADASEVGGS